jgi:hypothetical protein
MHQRRPDCRAERRASLCDVEMGEKPYKAAAQAGARRSLLALPIFLHFRPQAALSRDDQPRRRRRLRARTRWCIARPHVPPRSH